MSQTKRLLLGLLLIMLLLGLFQYFSQHASTKSSLNEHALEERMQWHITQVHRWQINPQQDKQIYLQAQSATQTELKGKEHLYFTQPQIVVLSANRNHYIESQKGVMIKTPNKQLLTLEGDVKMLNRRDPTDPLQTLTTELAIYDLSRQLLFAPNFARITQPNIEITGIGLTADLQQEQFQLKSSVKTHYQPQQQSTP